LVRSILNLKAAFNIARAAVFDARRRFLFDGRRSRRFTLAAANGDRDLTRFAILDEGIVPRLIE